MYLGILTNAGAAAGTQTVALPETRRMATRGIVAAWPKKEAATERAGRTLVFRASGAARMAQVHARLDDNRSDEV